MTLLRSPIQVIGYLLIWSFSAELLAKSEPQLEVSQQGDRFYLNLIAQSKLPIDTVWQLITDYPKIQKYHPSITHSEMVKRIQTGALVKTHLEDCVMFVCQSMERLEEVKLQGDYHLISKTIPEASDFKYGYQEWLLMPNGSGTTLFLRAEFETKEEVLPIFGPLLVEYKLKEATLEFIENIEKIDPNLFNHPTAP